jgi:hypothetical protein
MSFEACPVCGYALSVAGHHCRHCAPSLRVLPSAGADDPHRVTKAIIAAVVLLVLVYLIFFR